MTIKWCEYVVISTSHAHKGRNVAPTASHIYRLVGSISCLEGCRTPSQANMSESNSTHGKQGYPSHGWGASEMMRISEQMRETMTSLRNFRAVSKARNPLPARSAPFRKIGANFFSGYARILSKIGALRHRCATRDPIMVKSARYARSTWPTARYARASILLQ